MHYIKLYYRFINIIWQFQSDTIWKFQNEEVDDLHKLPSSWNNALTKTNQGYVNGLIWNYEDQPNFSIALKNIMQTEIQTECFNANRIGRLVLTASIIGNEKFFDLTKDLCNQGYKPFDAMTKLSWKYFKKTEDTGTENIYAYPYVNLKKYYEYKDGADGNLNVIRLPDGTYLGFDSKLFL